MTGKDMLKGIQNLDATLIEEAEFGTFQKKHTGFSGKKKLLFLLAATLIMGTMTAAAVFTRWSTTMQLGNYGGVQPSERIKKQAEQSGYFSNRQRHYSDTGTDSHGSVRRQGNLPH